MTTITKGACTPLFAFDLGFSIDLDRAERILARAPEGGAQRLALKHSRRAPSSFDYQPLPLRISRPATPIKLGDFTTPATVEIVLFDFGGCSVSYAILLEGPLERLLPLSHALYENAELLADARRHAAEVLAAMREAVTRPNLVDIVEDYIVFQLDQWSPDQPVDEFVDSQRRLLAQVLGSERDDLCDQEVDEAMTSRLSYSPRDAAIIEWNADIILGKEQDYSLLVLEFANLELLEMRYLDDRLDIDLERAHEATQRPPTLLGLLSYRLNRDLRHISSYQVDSALLFESVNNALKLLGDQYLARLYRLAAQRLHLPEWDASILRKLETLERIYGKLADRVNVRRTELLEWIVIILIAFEIVMSFVRGHA